MISEIFTTSYYGNTLLAWGASLLIILGSFIIGKVLYWISSHVIKKFTDKTKTKFDDILVDMIEEPLVFAIVLVGIWYSFSFLTFPEVVMACIIKIFKALIIFIVAWFITRFFDSLYREYLVPLAEKSKTDLDDQLLPIVRKGTKFVVWIIATIVALNNAGYDVGAVLAGLGIGGLAIAMAAKDTVANIFGGFTIFTDQPFKLNDRVKVAGFEGNIIEIGIRSTRLKTRRGRIVTIPNAKLSDAPVENVSREPSRKVIMKLRLTYDTTPKKMEEALAILNDISKENDSIEKSFQSFSEIEDSAMIILYIYYIKKGKKILKTKTEINLEILRRFNENKIELAFPSQTIYTKKC